MSSAGPSDDVTIHPSIRHPKAISSILSLPFESSLCRGREFRSHCGKLLGESGVKGELGDVSLEDLPLDEAREAMFFLSTSRYTLADREH